MRDLRELNRYRIGVELPAECFQSRPEDLDPSCAGAFLTRVQGVVLRIIASTGKGWDHVSVSTEHRTPTWDEMEHVKRLFFLETEVAMQLHVTPKEHVNNHPNCLHLWRPTSKLRRIPLPPKYMV